MHTSEGCAAAELRGLFCEQAAQGKATATYACSLAGECCAAWLCCLLLFHQVIEEEEEEVVLSKTGCFIWLAVVTVFISILSDYIMDAITGERGCRGSTGHGSQLGSFCLHCRMIIKAHIMPRCVAISRASKAIQDRGTHLAREPGWNVAGTSCTGASL